MKNERHIGFAVKSLSNQIKRMIDRNPIIPKPDGSPTSMQGWLIDFLYNNRDKDIYQRDIEAQFKIRRSTVTGLLKLMERDGLLTRESVAHDARLKKLILTKKAMEVHEEVHRQFLAVEKQLSKGLSEEELDLFLEICKKIERNTQ